MWDEVCFQTAAEHEPWECTHTHTHTHTHIHTHTHTHTRFYSKHVFVHTAHTRYHKFLLGHVAKILTAN